MTQPSNERGLGRLYAPDDRDTNYPLRLAALPPVVRLYRTWFVGRPTLDQNGFPHCVAFAWKQWLMCSPLRQGQNVDTAEVYAAAQLIDEWPGESYDGTSVRAGAKILQEKGFIANYLWASSAEEIKRWILTTGPVVVGVNWYEGMDKGYWSDKRFWIKPEGQLLGGHAFLVNGFSVNRKAFRMLNSWGTAWGEKGKAWLAEEHLQQLLLEQGEACTAAEQFIK